MTNNKTIQTLIKSYGIAFSVSLFFTSINAIVDLKDRATFNYYPLEAPTNAYILRFHFFCALGYAIPVSLLVFFIIRNPSRQVRIQKALRVFIYLALIIIGGFLGPFTVFKIIPEDKIGGLNDLLPWAISIVAGAILLPVAFFLYNSLYNRKNRRNS